MKKVKIGNRLVGQGEPVFIIAEAGVNHNGELDKAKQLIEIAAEAGVDAVKFQTIIPEDLVTEQAPKAAYQKVTTGAKESQLDMLRSISLSFDDFVMLKHYCDEKGIIFLSTPFDSKSIDFLADLGVPAIKVTSTDTNNLPA
ncbi:MAG: N-acetylneuraminate synthase family protein, partial [Deltaproteobacteria bacterium]|nr:N-acetylneuraminate synthase family protein [Deltaproteobacteria bacterium]